MTDKNQKIDTILFNGKEIPTSKLTVLAKQAIARQNELQREAARLETMLAEQMLLIKNYAEKIEKELTQIHEEMDSEESSEAKEGKPWNEAKENVQ